jgi:hypothetical protein
MLQQNLVCVGWEEKADWGEAEHLADMGRSGAAPVRLLGA